MVDRLRTYHGLVREKQCGDHGRGSFAVVAFSVALCVPKNECDARNIQKRLVCGTGRHVVAIVGSGPIEIAA
jgi:hypothetical protein